jgi:hypothetical protein
VNKKVFWRSVNMPNFVDRSKWLGREGYLLVRHTVYSISTDHVCGIEIEFRSGREAGCGWSRTFEAGSRVVVGGKELEM